MEFVPEVRHQLQLGTQVSMVLDMLGVECYLPYTHSLDHSSLEIAYTTCTMPSWLAWFLVRIGYEFKDVTCLVENLPISKELRKREQEEQERWGPSPAQAHNMFVHACYELEWIQRPLADALHEKFPWAEVSQRLLDTLSGLSTGSPEA